MPVTKKQYRQSVSLPPKVARRVKSLAKADRRSASRVVVDLIEKGLEAADVERKHFLDVGKRFMAATDKKEQKRLREELARLTFGE